MQTTCVYCIQYETDMWLWCNKFSILQYYMFWRRLGRQLEQIKGKKCFALFLELVFKTEKTIWMNRKFTWSNLEYLFRAASTVRLDTANICQVSPRHSLKHYNGHKLLCCHMLFGILPFRVLESVNHCVTVIPSSAKKCSDLAKN